MFSITASSSLSCWLLLSRCNLKGNPGVTRKLITYHSSITLQLQYVPITECNLVCNCNSGPSCFDPSCVEGVNLTGNSCVTRYLRKLFRLTVLYTLRTAVYGIFSNLGQQRGHQMAWSGLLPYSDSSCKE